MTTAWRKVATAAVIEIDWNWKTSSWEVKERQTKEGKIQLCKSISSRLWSRPEERSQVNAIGNDGDATKESHHIISCLRRRLRPQLKKREILLICILDWRNGQCFNETKESSSCATDSWLMKPWRGGRKKNLIKSCRCDNLASRFNYANTDTTHNDANESTSKPWNKTGLAAGWIINTIG